MTMITYYRLMYTRMSGNWIITSLHHLCRQNTFLHFTFYIWLHNLYIHGITDMKSIFFMNWY